MTGEARPKAGSAARSHKGTLGSGMRTRRSCPQLVIAAIALQHGLVAMGQQQNFTDLVRHARLSRSSHLQVSMPGRPDRPLPMHELSSKRVVGARR